MPQVKAQRTFKADLKKFASHKNRIRDIEEAVGLLRKGPPFPDNFINKPLKGYAKEIWDCHAQGDIVIVYEKRDDLILLKRVGTHSDLYKS